MSSSASGPTNSRSIRLRCLPRKPISTFCALFEGTCWQATPQDRLRHRGRTRFIATDRKPVCTLTRDLRTSRCSQIPCRKHLRAGSPNGLAAGSSDSSSTTWKTRSRSRRFQCFDFQANESNTRRLLEPLLFYILHRANARDRESRDLLRSSKPSSSTKPGCFCSNPSIQSYIVEALKTWRKHNAAMILSTQSLDELRTSDILDVIVESCVDENLSRKSRYGPRPVPKAVSLERNREVELISGAASPSSNS